MNARVKAPVHLAIPTPLDAASRSATVDASRGLAALLVYFSHTGTALVLPPLVLYGDSGVHLFFVLSGYLLYGPFAKALMESSALPSTGRFYMRRLLRIWPPFAVALVVSSLARYVLRHQPPSVGLLLEHVLFVTNYDFRAGPPAFYRINAVFWTLAIEAQFYLLLPLLALFARRLSASRPLRAAWLPIALCVAVGPCARAVEFALTHAGALRFRTLPSFLDLFGWGMAVAVVEARGGLLLRGRHRPLASCAAGGLGLILLANEYRHVMGTGWLDGDNRRFTLLFPLLIGAGFAAILRAAVCATWRGLAARLRRPFAAVGTVSYSLYLYHILVQQLLFRTIQLPPVDNFYLRGLVAGLFFLPATLAVSAAAYWLFERPSLLQAQRLRGAVPPRRRKARPRATARPVATP